MPDNNDNHPVFEAIKSNDEKRLCELIRHRANVNIKNSHDDTPLHIAALLGRQRLVSLLLAAGADPMASNNAMMTPQHLAANAGHMFVADNIHRSLTANADYAARIDRERRNTDPTRGRG